MLIRNIFLILSFLLFTPCYASVSSDKNIFIFISFSMPDASLKAWMQEAKKIDAPLVVRGFINHSFKDTINRISELTKDNQGGVHIDPRLFKQFRINKVPAVVVKESYCLSGMSCPLDYDLVYGDITLAYALKKIADAGNSVSASAKKSLTHLNIQRSRHAS